MRRIVLVVAALALVGAAGCRSNRIKAEDEGPIIVKNGSMTIDTAMDARWDNDNNQWSNETGKTHRGELYVRVDLTNGEKCTGSGNPVHIETNEPSFTAKFNIVGSPARTKVTPKNDFTRQSDQRLRHDDTGTATYITKVKINGSDLACNITKDNLTAVSICSSPDVAACKP